MDSREEHAKLLVVGVLLGEVKPIVFWDISPKMHSLVDALFPCMSVILTTTTTKKSHEVMG